MRHSIGIRLLTWGIVAAFALGLGACRSVSPPAARSPMLQLTVPPRSSVTQVLGATPEPVAVTVETVQYAPGDTIVVTIYNRLATPIFARDGRSDCTAVDLERWVNNVWRVQIPCVNMQPAPHVVQLAPNAVLTQQLVPSLSDSIAGSWPAGTYRVAFAYVTSTDQPFGQSTVIYSARFTIG